MLYDGNCRINVRSLHWRFGVISVLFIYPYSKSLSDLLMKCTLERSSEYYREKLAEIDC